MQIIWTDNFARDNVSERLVAKDIKHLGEAEAMLQGLRATCTSDGPNWYEMRPDDYIPFKWEP